MRRLRLLAFFAAILVLSTLIGDHFSGLESRPSPARSVFPSDASEGTSENLHARLEFDWLRLHDPATGRIPKGIAGRELAFAQHLVQQTDLQSVSDDGAWISRGPSTIGGRTRAMAIDVTNEDVILAGGVSSGMFMSTDGGSSWTKTTAPNQLHSVTSVVQNRTAGKENFWYYGTGDRAPFGLSTSAEGLLGTKSVYRGDGIFKSVDGGSTWHQLEATISGTPDHTDAFDFVWKLATFGEGGVLAATASGVFKSTDGGESWTQPFDLGDNENSPSTEVAVASDGSFYVTISGDGPENGIYRSADGDTWENISPVDWPEATVKTVIGVAPSKPNSVYFFTHVASLQQQLWKYEVGVGWTDLTGGLPFNAQMTTYGGSMLNYLRQTG